ncbi:MAG: hypothetical protein Q7S66_03880 [bacterium]|nr:hypothetical protein [bacterium]
MLSMNKYQKFLFSYVVLLLAYWVLLAFSAQKTSFWNYFFSFAFSLIPLLGGLVGCYLSSGWGGLKSALGRGIFFISLGHFMWGAGSMIWSYYNFFESISAPYPSLADIGFVASLPLWVVGIVNISKAAGAGFGLRNKKGKSLLLILPLLVIFISYYLLVVVARGGTLISSPDHFDLKFLLDMAYPAGDVVILTASLLVYGLSSKFLGGTYKSSILFILLGFSVMYLADFIFSYTTTVETFFNGDFGDLVFCLALATILFGVFSFDKNKHVAGSQT